MTNAELIKALRYCGDEALICGEECPLFNKEQNRHCDVNICYSAADALEAADERIARLEEDLKTREAEREVMQDTIKVCEKRIAELEAQAETLKEESEAYKFVYLDGKTESDRQIEDLQTALTACRLRKDEAQLPKEGEWIRKEVKVYCPRDCWNPSACAIEGTWNEEEGWNLEMQDGFCSVCGEQDDQYYKDNYCPNCGSKMKGARQCD